MNNAEGIDHAEGISESADRAARELRVMFSRLRRRLREVSDSQDLTPSQVSALNRLSKAGAATASGLAASEGVRPQSMAATLAALDQHGLIERFCSTPRTAAASWSPSPTPAARARKAPGRPAANGWPAPSRTSTRKRSA